MAVLSRIYAGINGCVIALDETTGSQIWSTKLKGGEFVNVMLAESKLYATTKGEIFCLDPETGEILWNNQLKGMGRGIVCIAAPEIRQNPVAAAKHKKDQDDTAAAAAATAAGS